VTCINNPLGELLETLWSHRCHTRSAFRTATDGMWCWIACRSSESVPVEFYYFCGDVAQPYPHDA
jgi:hypothetical protein